MEVCAGVRGHPTARPTIHRSPHLIRRPPIERNAARMTEHMRSAIAFAEETSRCCLLECDGPGNLDDRVVSEPGMTMIVVKSYCTLNYAERMGAPWVTNFDTAVLASTTWRRGPCVVSDRAVKFMACLLRCRVQLVLLEGIEGLTLPKCPEILADVVWITRFSARQVHHTGWARECYMEAISNDAVIRRRGQRFGMCPMVLPVTRDLYFDVRGEDSEVTRTAVEHGDMDLAVRSFPGRFELEDKRVRTGECPVCYEQPVPRVTSGCCGRDFCLACISKCVGDVSSCPWCRASTGLWNFCIEAEPDLKTPFKDALLRSTVSDCIGSAPDSKVLVVTTDDVYTYKNSKCNPLMAFSPCMIAGSAVSVNSALRAFSEDGRVAVTHADRMFCCGITFPATHVVFTEKAARSGDRLKFWVGACPRARAARCMTAITEALS